MNLDFLSSKNDPSGTYATFEKGGRGDLNSLAATPSFKSPSLPLWESGMTQFHVRPQIIGAGGAA
jgi:hypothetical protein